MFAEEYNGINSFLIGISNLLLKYGVCRKTRNFVCWELPGPIIIKIKNPAARWVTIPERNWNLTLPYAESLWLASGRNDINFISHYLRKMKAFSDDGLFMRAGYGPRLRFFDGSFQNFERSDSEFAPCFDNGTIDQFYYIEKLLKKHPDSRRAILTIGSPTKDTHNTKGEIKETKDFPCTCSLHFMIEPTNNKLDLIVHIRSNDFVWGASAVNIFNFTFIQEYFSAFLGVEMGAYYHIVNNLHYYEDQKKVVENISKLNPFNIEDIPFEYDKKFSSLSEFDEKIKKMSIWEEELRKNKTSELISFEDGFFDDWAKILYRFTTKKEIKCTNFQLNKLLKK